MVPAHTNTVRSRSRNGSARLSISCSSQPQVVRSVVEEGGTDFWPPVSPSEIQSSVTPSEVTQGTSAPQTGVPEIFDSTLPASVDLAQVLSGDTLHQDGVMKEPAPVLPAMSPIERADLSRMAQRNFFSDVEAYHFWHELVTTAAFFRMFEERP